MHTLASVTFWIAALLAWSVGGAYAYTQSRVWPEEPKPTDESKIKAWKQRRALKLALYSAAGWFLWLRKDVMTGLKRDWMLDDAKRFAQYTGQTVQILELKTKKVHVINADGTEEKEDDDSFDVVEMIERPAVVEPAPIFEPAPKAEPVIVPAPVAPRIYVRTTPIAPAKKTIRRTAAKPKRLTHEKKK